jgi:hypothetical protein
LLLLAVEQNAEFGGKHGFDSSIFAAANFVDFLVVAQKAATSDDNLPLAVTLAVPYNAFLQKMVLPKGARVAVFGDMHGSLHSMLRELVTLREMAAADGSGTVLGENLELTDKAFYIVMCGDFVDRGINGPELLALILLLRHKNPGQVVLVRGCVSTPRLLLAPLLRHGAHPPTLSLLFHLSTETTRISRRTTTTRLTRTPLRIFSFAKASPAQARARTRWPYRKRTRARASRSTL